MTTLSYHLLDVFTDRPFAGNPLAVVEDADGLSALEMQAIAREFNLSETVFLLEPRDPAHSARLRIFTPAAELPFAGHPTVGAAVLLAETRAGDLLSRHGVAVALECALGVIRCEALRSRSGVTYAELTLPTTPETLEGAPSPETLAEALSLASGDIGFGEHAPAIHAAGPAFVYAPVVSRAALDRARPSSRFSAVIGRAAGVYLYTRETVAPESAIYARMLAHGLGIDEDPATGSAAAAFAAVAARFERPEDGEHELFIEQGYAMGRPSRITLRMTVEKGALARVAIGGQAVRVAEGRLL